MIFNQILEKDKLVSVYIACLILYTSFFLSPIPLIRNLGLQEKYRNLAQKFPGNKKNYQVSTFHIQLLTIEY